MSARSYLLGRRAGWRTAASSGLTIDTALRTSSDATYRSEALDGHRLRCVWDILRCRIQLGSGSLFAFSTHTSDVDRGDAGVAALPDDEWTEPVTVMGPYDGAWDALITSPPGQFLWLRLQLVGSSNAEGVVHWITIDYPRNTSLRLLPAVFSSAEGGRDLNEQLMAFFDAMHSGVLDEIRELASVIDPRTTDAKTKRDFLSWLAAWLDVDIFRSWPVGRRRAVVAHAGELFRLRGTPRGIKLFVELATGRQIEIVEQCYTRDWWFASTGLLGCSVLFGPVIASRARLDGSSRIGSDVINSTPSPYLDPFRSKANAFCVFVLSLGACDDMQIATIRCIIEAEKPAHTTFDLYAARAEMLLGVSSQLGLDSIVGNLSPPAILPGPERVPRLGVSIAL